MTEVRSSMTILEDSGQAGVPLHKVLSGDSPAGKNAIVGYSFKDASGNVVLPQLNADGAIQVTFDITGQASLSNEGGVAGSTSLQTLTTITLVNDATYKNLSFLGSCFRDAYYEVVQIDDSAGTPAETLHAVFRTGAGQLNESENMDNLMFTAGSTGVCLLRIRAKQLQNVSSQIDGAIAIFEQQ